MDQEANQMQQPHPVLCRTGCGFYASQSTEGMCSVCYKEHIKKRQAPPVNMPASLAPNQSSFAPSSSSSSSSSVHCEQEKQQQTQPRTESSPVIDTSASSLLRTPTKVNSESLALSDLCTTTPPPSSQSAVASLANVASATEDGGSTSSTENSPDSSTGGKTPKKQKSRCQICKTKVGLTGFTCRCGGLYCSLHRYSDTHNCQFDYHELGADEIRRSNPVVVAKKVDKI